MIVQEVNEQNYQSERQKGELEIQEKFDKWDQLGLQKDILSKKEFLTKLGKLCEDPTIWAYGTLNDKQNKKLECWYYQDKIMNDHNRFIHITAANQIGKTWSGGIIKGFHHALMVNNASVMLISRGEDQAKGILDEIKWMGERSRVRLTEFFDDVSNRTELHLPSPDGIGTSVIRVFPPTKKILSFPATLVILDETGFWEKECELDPIEYYQQCVEPRTNQTKNWEHPFLRMGQIVSITNPNGQSGLAWNLYNDSRFHQYVYNWLACPINTYKEYKEQEQRLPPIRFASIYAATYLSASGGFITTEQYNKFAAYNSELTIKPGMVLFLGGDHASEEPKSRHTDWSTLYGVIQVPNKDFPQYPRIRVVYRRDFQPRTPKRLIYEEIEKIKKMHGVEVAGYAYDKVGVGDSVKTDLIGRGTLYEKQIEALTYSLPCKSEVYLNFQNLFRQDMIEGLDIPKLKQQILALKVEQPIGSIHIKVHHKTEGVKDDEPDALANACYIASRPFVKSSLEFLPTENKDIVQNSTKTAICTVCDEYFQTNKATTHFQKLKCPKHSA